MRLKRVAAQIAAAPNNTQPTHLALYDDAAVACDRLARDDEALNWIERKHRLLVHLDAHDPVIHDHWYRYHANAGTFLAHRWVRNGANRSRISEMVQACNDIAQAIKINPNAHFGREKYQLKAMEWIVHPPAIREQSFLPDFLGLSSKLDFSDDPQKMQKLGYADAEKGLCGLVTLGSAWESIDIFYALKLTEMVEKNSTLAYLAHFRLQELIKAHRHSLHPNYPVGQNLEDAIASAHLWNDMWWAPEESPQQLRSVYDRLRAEAEVYQQRRTDYMMQRLQAGRHPDTDPTFWNEWHDAGPPPVRVEVAQPLRWLQTILFSLIGLTFCSLFFLRLARHRREA
jgi:hypothetical protein